MRSLFLKQKHVLSAKSALTVSALACAILSAAPAQAFEIFGVRLWGAETETTDTEIIDPKNYTVNLDISGDEDAESSIQSTSSLWSGRDSPVGGSAGLIARAKGDYRRIQAALYNEGYYAGTIRIVVNGQEASDLPVGTDVPELSQVDITISTGPQFLFGEAAIINAAPPPTDRNDDVTTPQEEGFVTGEAAKAPVIKNAGRLAVDAWREQGFAKAKVENRNIIARHEQNLLNAELTIAPGLRASYGDVTVEGTDRMDPEFVRYMAGLEPGVEYDPDDIERAQKRLDRLGVFSSRRILEADLISEDGSLPMTINVTERKPRRLGAGATLSTLDGLGLEAFWLHRNLFGKAESLKVEAKVEGIGATLDYTKLNYSTGATFRKPGFITRDTDLVANITGNRQTNDIYTETAAEASIGLQYFYSDQITFSGAPYARIAEYDDAFGTRTFKSVGLRLAAEFDMRDNKLDPAAGYFARIEARPFYEMTYQTVGLRGVADLRAYYAIDQEDRIIVAGRVKAGSTIGADIAEISPYDVFLGGGGGSVRGYDYQSIGVVGPNGQTVGGKSILEASAELRVKATDTIGFAAFVDAAQVSSDTLPNFDNDLRIGVGAGLRYYTGLGPIRLDVAVPLNRKAGDPAFGIYAGIGQAF